MNQMNEPLGRFIGLRRNVGAGDKMAVRGNNALGDLSCTIHVAG